ncbi:MAG: hypothetical protein R2861_16325 [Desulfobacterales bacterium]
MAQPVSVKTDEFYEQIAEMAPDLLVVVAFGHVLLGGCLIFRDWQ